MTRAGPRDPDAIRRRAEAMLRRRVAGYSMAEIAAEHRPTPRHVRRELAGLPEVDRRGIERAWRDATLGHGWRGWPR